MTNHARAARAAVRPTLRAGSLVSASATAGLAILPVVVTVARGGHDLLAASVLAAVVGGAVVAWAVEDDFGDTLAAAPVSAPERLAMRLAAIAVISCLAWAAAVTTAIAGPGLPSMVADRLPEAAAAAGLAVAIALLAARRGESAVGPIGVIAGALATAIVAALSLRWQSLPTFLPSPAHSRWWLVAAVGACAALWYGRDSGRK